MNDHTPSSLRKEAIWRLLRLAKLEMESGRFAMASRLLADAADLVEYGPEQDFSDPLPGNGADPEAPPCRKQ